MNTPAASSIQPAGPIRGIHRWIVNHDDSRLFLVLYLGLAVVLSIFISLFWLLAVVAVHFAFEVIRQRTAHPHWVTVISEALWELKLDIALVLFALVVALYMDTVLAVVGLRGVARLGSAAQVGLRSSARFAAWQRVLRGILMSVDDAAQVARTVVSGRYQAAERQVAPPVARTRSILGSWASPWRRGDWIALGMSVVCLLLLAGAPVLTDHTFHSALVTLVAELQPLPMD